MKMHVGKQSYRLALVHSISVVSSGVSNKDSNDSGHCASNKPSSLVATRYVALDRFSAASQSSDYHTAAVESQLLGAKYGTATSQLLGAKYGTATSQLLGAK